MVWGSVGFTRATPCTSMSCMCKTSCFARTPSHTTQPTHHTLTSQVAGGHPGQHSCLRKRRVGLRRACSLHARWVREGTHFAYIGYLHVQVPTHSCCAYMNPPATHTRCMPTLNGCATRDTVHTTLHTTSHCHAHAPLTHPSARVLARCAAHHSNTHSHIALCTTHVPTGPIGTGLLRSGGLVAGRARG